MGRADAVRQERDPPEHEPRGHRPAGPRGRRSGRVGVAATNECTPEGARKAAQSAKEMAEIVAARPVVARPRAGAPTPAGRPVLRGNGERLARDARRSGRRADRHVRARVHGRGRLRDHGDASWGSPTPRGSYAGRPRTQASLTTVMIGPEGGSGFAEAFSGSVEAIDAGAIGRRANDKAVGSALADGPRCGHLPRRAGAGRDGHAGRLPRLGGVRRQAATWRTAPASAARRTSRWRRPSISIWDDGADPRTLGAPFDFEGVPKQRVDLIRDGVFLDAVYDLRTGKEAGVPSTGHGLPSPNPEGPFPLQPVHGHR